MSTATVPRNQRILVVDDNQSIHDDFRKSVVGPGRGGLGELDDAATALFGADAKTNVAPADDFQIDSAFQGQEALQCVRRAVEANTPYAVAFVDVRMPPGWDGIETIHRLWEVDPDLQVVICTAYSDLTVDQILNRLGKTNSLLILKKPFDPMEVRLMATTLTEKWRAERESRQHILGLEEWAVDAERVMDVIQASHAELEHANISAVNEAAELTRLVQQRTAEAVATRDVAVFALAKLAESRDAETGEHLERIREYCQILAERLAASGPYAALIDDRFLEDFFRSSPLHDIGKVGIPDKILLKPGPLTPAEFDVMRQHTVIGAEALREAASQSDYGGFLEMAAEIARYHHEWMDGTGYPEGLKGHRIPLSARIVALGDAFDALTSVRVYKGAMSVETARKLIESEEGTHYDPIVVGAFRDCYDRFVEVHNGFHSRPSGPAG